ncbi:hypothetical protein GE21DRAFT_1669 [Neurospora crassa]|uniref:Uncharacterized protein n=1 Tax=Neurospora crassa (strain ATCC 24698 / 74-OR23-1A / CBS 708.71 / DSM 1257 / FGSC 987) TaxID=367110 RepID=A7UXF8_NEUCR|nr:hypothetical protein NCU10702 [Neurospora crassa OR74A]EDO64889.2 hypothetical protein NCU10702 [Neurospora crassa OR74A]KHE82141.1 hypothetical protein GE21DRAFT_1669 [Neurospora crassa]|eukprot:XP_001727980.2 hypothetical protein NCU10702 [Neurospora crassa OR74A]
MTYLTQLITTTLLSLLNRITKPRPFPLFPSYPFFSEEEVINATAPPAPISQPTPSTKSSPAPPDNNIVPTTLPIANKKPAAYKPTPDPLTPAARITATEKQYINTKRSYSRAKAKYEKAEARLTAGKKKGKKEDEDEDKDKDKKKDNNNEKKKKKNKTRNITTKEKKE